MLKNLSLTKYCDSFFIMFIFGCFFKLFNKNYFTLRYLSLFEFVPNEKGFFLRKIEFGFLSHFKNTHLFFSKFFKVFKIHNFFKICIINFKFDFYKPMFNTLYEVFYCGYNVFFQKDIFFENETLSFFKYLYGLKNFKSNDLLFDSIVFKKNSFIWKNFVTSFSFKNFVKFYILTDVLNKQGVLAFFRSFRSPLIIFVDPSYYNPGLDFYFFVKKNDYISRYLFLSIVLSFYNLYKFSLHLKFFKSYVRYYHSFYFRFLNIV